MKLGFSKNKPKRKGKLIVIDGVDGSGKATQTKLLAEQLVKDGFEIEIADFPQYGKKSAGAVEEYLSGKYGAVDPYAGSVFYAVDRFDASFNIREKLESGKIVISNRYVTASAGHQGSKIADRPERIKFFKWLDNLEYKIFNIPKPDLNVILHVPVKVARKLMAKRQETRKFAIEKGKRDIHERDMKHLERAEKVFLEICGLFPNTKLVECFEDNRLLTPQEVHNKVWYWVRRQVLEKFK